MSNALGTEYICEFEWNFVATCTLLPLGGLTLLGLSAALCLGDVKTASFEILYNSKEIKHFLSFANQSLSHLRRKLP